MLHRRWRRVTTSLAVVALMATACGGDDEAEGGDGATTEATQTETGGATESSETATGGTETEAGGGGSLEDVAMDVGVTADPCPEPVNDGNGCIYLGIISDFSGPFQTFGGPLTEGQQAFWEWVNENGGIGGMFDVAIPEDLVLDAEYNPTVHAEAYAQLEPQIAALAQSLGTPQTQPILPNMAEDDMIAATATWWSGWEFEDNIVEYGSNYCIDAMNGLDWMVEQGNDITTAMHIGFPGDYGGDSRAGLAAAAEANGVEVVAEVDQTPISLGGNVTEAVNAIVGNSPDLVFMSVGPQEAAQIVGGAAQNGYQGIFVGSHPVFLPDLMDSPAAPALEAMLTIVGPQEAWDGDTEGHQNLRDTYEAMFGGPPANDGATFGWTAEYPIRTALETALANGDLTRSGIVAAAQDMSVDFDGMVPETQFGGDPNDTVTRTTVISRPSGDATLGIGTVEAGYTGPTAEGYDFTEPCVTLG